MHFNKRLFFIFFILQGGALFAQKKINLVSPNGKIHFAFSRATKGPSYSVQFNGKTLIDPSSISLSFADKDDLGKDLMRGTPVFSEGEDNYSLPAGKTSMVHD